MTILFGINDINRKFYLLKQLTFMLSAKKIRNLDLKKDLPTMNIIS